MTLNENKRKNKAEIIHTFHILKALFLMLRYLSKRKEKYWIKTIQCDRKKGSLEKRLPVKRENKKSEEQSKINTLVFKRKEKNWRRQ